MIRSIPLRHGHNFRNGRGRIGDATSALIGGGISAGVSLATDAAGLWMQSIQLSHNADSATTAIVNGLATQLMNVSHAYFSLSNPTCADQRAALDAIDQGIAWLQSPAACGNPNYGAAGNRCISERAFPGAKYSYVDEIRTPIANDPRVSGAACDTGAQIFLPSLSTGTYQATSITSTGGSAATGANPDTTPVSAGTPIMAAGDGTSLMSASAQLSTGIPAWAIVGGLAFAGLFLFGGSR